jgi:hypothetical protein
VKLVIALPEGFTAGEATAVVIAALPERERIRNQRRADKRRRAAAA